MDSRHALRDTLEPIMSNFYDQKAIWDRLEKEPVGTYLILGRDDDADDEGLILRKVASGAWKIAEPGFEGSYRAVSIAGMLCSDTFPWNLS